MNTRIRLFHVFACLLALAATPLAWSQNGAPRAPAPGTQSADAIDEAALKNADNFFAVELSDGQHFSMAKGPVTSSQKVSWSSLTHDQQLEFIRVRSLVLGSLAQTLSSSHLALGTGALVGDKLAMVRDHVIELAKKPFKKNAALDTQIAENPIEVLAEEMVEIEAKQGVVKKRSVKDMGHAVVQGLIDSVDQQLLENSALIVNSEEFGLSAFMGLVGIQGVGEKVAGGVGGVGIKIGFNKKAKGVVFEVFAHGEKAVRAVTPTLTFGLVPKIGAYVQTEHKNLRTGGGFYPMAVPLAEEHGEGIAKAMMSPALLSWPPSPVGDYFSYKTQYHTLNLARVSTSPLVPGWVRLQSGVGEVVRENPGYIKKLYESLVERVRSVPLIECMPSLRAVFRR